MAWSIQRITDWPRGLHPAPLETEAEFEARMAEWRRQMVKRFGSWPPQQSRSTSRQPRYWNRMEMNMADDELSEFQRASLKRYGTIPVNLPQLGDVECDECGAPGGIHTGRCSVAQQSGSHKAQPLETKE